MRVELHGGCVRPWFMSLFSREALGLAFLQMWSMSLYSGTTLGSAAGDPLGWGSLAHRVALVTIIVFLFAMAVCRNLSVLLSRKPFQMTSVIAIEVGTLCIFAMAWTGENHLALIGLGTLCTGVGSALLTAAWCAAYARLEPKAVFPTTVGAFLFSNLFVAALGEYPTAASYVMVVLAPLASIVCLDSVSVALFGEHPHPYGAPLQTQPALSAPAFARTVLYAFLFSAVVGAVGSFDKVGGGVGADYGILGLLAIVAGAVLATVVLGDLTNGPLMAASGILLAIALLAIPFFYESPALQTLAFASKMLGRIAIWAYIALAFLRGGCNPLLFFGMTLGMHYAGMMAGELLTRVIFPATQTSTELELFMFSLVAMFLLAIAYLLGMQSVAPRKDGGSPREEPRPYDEKVAQVSAHFGLTEREQVLLWHLAKGYSTKSIQQKLNISASTVSAHSGNIYRKMDVHSKDEAAEIIRAWSEEG